MVVSPPSYDYKRRLAKVFGAAFVAQPRSLTPGGLTKPGHVAGVRDAGPGRVVVLVAARDEELLIGEALESLAAQTRIADK